MQNTKAEIRELQRPIAESREVIKNCEKDIAEAKKAQVDYLILCACILLMYSGRLVNPLCLYFINSM